MTITFLGTGTSHGIPMVGCTCPVCRSDVPENRRTRASLWIRTAERSILIDAGPEFRLQAVREGMRSLDALFLTHAHADHLHGLDDIRPLSVDRAVPVYGNEPAILELRERFAYIFRTTQEGGGKPRLDLHILNGKPVAVGSLSVTPVPILHGELPILGYRIGPFAYLTDCSAIPDPSRRLLEGLRVLVIGALRHRPHPTHFTVKQAVETAAEIGAEQVYLTHMTHDLDHDSLERELPPGVRPAFDGLTLEVSDV